MKKIKEKITRTVFIPKSSRNDDSQFVAVNGKRILVKKGETVSLPEAFYEVIMNSERAAEDARLYIDGASREI